MTGPPALATPVRDHEAPHTRVIEHVQEWWNIGFGRRDYLRTGRFVPSFDGIGAVRHRQDMASCDSPFIYEVIFIVSVQAHIGFTHVFVRAQVYIAWNYRMVHAHTCIRTSTLPQKASLVSHVDRPWKRRRLQRF